MDGNRFDSLARTIRLPRSRWQAAAALAAVFAGAVGVHDQGDAKKKHRRKKKPCATRCATGCCTGKRGACIQPAQQSETRCGTGGAICQSTGCRQCSASTPCPTGQCCSGAGRCGPCIVFASSAETDGDLGGLAGADATCQSLAGAAGLPGVYKAWLSDVSATPATRFIKSTEPHTLRNGIPIANPWTGLVSSPLLNAIDRDEFGAVITGQPNQAWTDSQDDGTLGDATFNGDCQGWHSNDVIASGTYGSMARTTRWSQDGFKPCASSASLYCFQQS